MLEIQKNTMDHLGLNKMMFQLLRVIWVLLEHKQLHLVVVVITIIQEIQVEAQLLNKMEQNEDLAKLRAGS